MEKPTTPQRRREQGALRRAIACFGSQAALARAIDPDMAWQAVQGWMERQVPYDRCRDIERVTRGMVQCEELNEDYARTHERPYRREA